MTGYTVVSSVRLPEQSAYALLNWVSPSGPIHGPARCVNSLPRWLSIVLQTRTIKFKGIIFQGG